MVSTDRAGPRVGATLGWKTLRRWRRARKLKRGHRQPDDRLRASSRVADLQYRLRRPWDSVMDPDFIVDAPSGEFAPGNSWNCRMRGQLIDFVQ